MSYYADQPVHANKRQASLLAHALAWFVDGIVSVIALLAILIPVMVLFAPSEVSLEAAEGIGTLVGLVFLFVYYIGTEAAWSRTPGKMVLGIRVVQTDGRECSAGGAIARNITKILGGAALFPVLVAVLLILSTDDNQRLGDILGNTTVVSDS